MMGGAQVMQFNAVLRTILPKLFNLHPREFVLDRLVLIYCRHVVIRSGNGSVWVLYSYPSFLQIQESHG